MNITSNPHLNLKNLNDYKLSKAYQLENSTGAQQQNQLPSKIIEVIPIEVVETPKIKILNSQAVPAMASIFPKTMKTIQQDQKYTQTRTPKRSIEDVQSLSPVPKQMKFDDVPILTTIKLDNSPEKSEALNEAVIEENLFPKPQNKLLALFEVTTDQYQELSQRLSASERSHKIESLVTSFLDKENNETETSNENGEHKIIFLNLNFF